MLSAKLHGPLELKSMQFAINCLLHLKIHIHLITITTQTTHHTQSLNDKTGKFAGGNGFSVPTYGGMHSPELILVRKTIETGDSEILSVSLASKYSLR